MPENRHSVIGEGTTSASSADSWWPSGSSSSTPSPVIPSRPPACSARWSSWAIDPDSQWVVFGAILLYTAFHFIVFALIGMGLVAMVHWGVENPVVRYALLPVFLVFEVLFYGLSRGPVGAHHTSCSRSGPWS